MQDIDYSIESDASLVSPKEQTCLICGKHLSKYNKLGRCFHHPDPEKERRRLKRKTLIAALNERSQLPVIQVASEAPPHEIPPEHAAKDIISEEKIITLVCELFGFSREELVAQGRQVPIVRARHTLMYLLYTDTSLPYTDVAVLLGGRDHTTVLHGVSKIEEALKTDLELQKVIHYIRSHYHPPKKILGGFLF